MRLRSAHFRAIPYLIALAIFACGHDLARAAEGQAPGRSVAFFCQGQSIYNPQDQAKSQQQAIQDFLGQAITQAAGRFMSPSQMGSQFADLQKKIFPQVPKYVDSYQVFSETQVGGLFRVIGQVTVAMDVLRKDLEEAGFPVAEAAQASPAATVAATGDKPKPGASRGLAVTKKEILWAVPEKWEQEWIIPGGKRDASSLFAQAIIRELDDYDYTLHFPERGSVKMDYTGNITQTQVTTLAQGLGIQDAVVGTLTLKQERNKPARLEANLRVIKVAAGKIGGEITREVSLEDVSNQEGALDLASRITPQLYSLLGGAGEAERKVATTPAPEPEKQAGGETSGQPSEAAGRWTLTLPSSQYAHWKEIERVLREQFKSMHIVSLEMGLTEGNIKLDGVDGNFVSGLNGTSLPSGATVRVDSFSAEARTIKLSFTPPGTVQAEPKK
ncbi:MAG: hypothetical protein WAW37_19200 [Syntrophobacteraceae bacterium]